MKISLLVTTTILLIGVVLGIRNQTRISAAETHIRQHSGKSLSPPVSSSTHPSTRSQRGRPDTDIPGLAAGLIAFAHEIEANLDQREQTILDWQRRLSALTPDQINTLLTEIRDASLSDSTRLDLLRITLQAHSLNHPLEILSILSATPGLFTDPWTRAAVATEALVRGMEKDPAASIAWFKEHRASFTDTIRDSVTEKILRRTGLIDPELALTLISDLSITDTGHAVRMILNPSRSDEQRDAALLAVREHLTTITDPAGRENLAFEASSTLIGNALYHGLHKGLAWIDQAGFSQQELEAYTSRTTANIIFTDPERWMNWLTQNIPTEITTTQTIPSLIWGWTRRDHQAVGAWLETVPDGPVKSSAAARYAEVLAPHHPGVAARWFNSLPPEHQQPATKTSIHQSLLHAHPAAAEAFARQHGIE